MFTSAGARMATKIPTRPLFSMFIFILALSLLIPLLISNVSLGIINSWTVNCYNNIFQRNIFNVSKRYFVSDTGNHSSFSSSSSSSSHHSNSGNGHYGQSTTDLSGPFTYKSTVAYQPKDRDDAIYQKLKDSLLSPTGEDNYFITTNSVSDLYVGVADGVGGWAEHGYDSSAISRELCKAMDQLSSTLKQGKLNDSQDLKVLPKEILDLSYNKLKDEKIVEVGGTTAIVAHFPDNGLLKVANLGDSWCGVFRDSHLVFQTKFQTVGFNAPYQLSIIPEEMERQARLSGRSYIQNTPKDADEYEFQLKSKDVVILATDGVTDNIATGDIGLFLEDNKELLDTDLNKASSDLVQNVVKISKDPEFPSIFAQEISKLTGKIYKGGKEDDITLVLVKVD